MTGAMRQALVACASGSATAAPRPDRKSGSARYARASPALDPLLSIEVYGRRAVGHV